MDKNQNLALEVKRLIGSDIPRYSFISRVASELCCSERTLKRKLKMQNTCFRTLLMECRIERAFIELPHRSVGQVSDLLGYKTQFAFSQAFKNWTGNSPMEYASAARVA